MHQITHYRTRNSIIELLLTKLQPQSHYIIYSLKIDLRKIIYKILLFIGIVLFITTHKTCR